MQINIISFKFYSEKTQKTDIVAFDEVLMIRTEVRISSKNGSRFSENQFTRINATIFCIFVD